MGNSSKRGIILHTANRLFESAGFYATGVDQIASESGVTKRTLYKQFGSKEGLIEAVLRQHHQDMMERVRAGVLAVDASGADRLMACFDLYRDWFARPNFSGCIFIKTINEFGGCSPRLSSIAQESKRAMRDFMVELAVEAGVSEPQKLAEQLHLLLEGSIVIAQFDGGVQAIATAREIATNIISVELP
jgi:AcrR family transcriptional regulator